jgi:hypothetical protein
MKAKQGACSFISRYQKIDRMRTPLFQVGICDYLSERYQPQNSVIQDIDTSIKLLPESFVARTHNTAIRKCSPENRMELPGYSVLHVLPIESEDKLKVMEKIYRSFI